MALSDVILEATLNDLAERHKEEGRYADAEPLYKRVLAINEKTHGPDHPSVALALNDLAELYKEEGRYTDAEPLYERALATWKKVLGPDHPDVAQSLNNLADLYRIQGRTPMPSNSTSGRWRSSRKGSAQITPLSRRR